MIRIGYPIESSFRVLEENEVTSIRLMARAKFMDCLNQYGLTVLPEFQEKWWHVPSV